MHLSYSAAQKETPCTFFLEKISSELIDNVFSFSSAIYTYGPNFPQLGLFTTELAYLSVPFILELACTAVSTDQLRSDQYTQIIQLWQVYMIVLGILNKLALLL